MPPVSSSVISINYWRERGGGRTVSFLKMASFLEDACACFFRYGALVALTTVFPPVAACVVAAAAVVEGDEAFFPVSTSALLLLPPDDPACGKHVTTYATCKTVKTGKSLSSVETGLATSAGNRTA